MWVCSWWVWSHNTHEAVFTQQGNCVFSCVSSQMAASLTLVNSTRGGQKLVGGGFLYHQQVAGPMEEPTLWRASWSGSETSPPTCIFLTWDKIFREEIRSDITNRYVGSAHVPPQNVVADVVNSVPREKHELLPSPRVMQRAARGSAKKGGAPKGGGGHPRVGGTEGWGPEGVCQEGLGPEGWRPEGWGPKGGGPKISRFFPPLPPQFSFFLLSLGGPFVEFWWCF